MDRKKIAKVIAGSTVKILNRCLHVEANTTSCIAMYQPKAPDALSRFKRK